MDNADVMLPDDARLYGLREYRSVFPLPEWPDLTRWKRQRSQIRRHLLLCAGLNERTAAFRARGRVVKSFSHEGLIVENICIETLPGLYLMGNLYRPADAEGPVPLVLHPHGHAMNARTQAWDLYSVPHRAMNHALLGMAAFAYSMIGYDQDAAQLEHRTLLQGPEKEVCNTLGLSMFGLQLNNSIKALDYLCSREDIDGRRVGCTGESGGGTQTYFLAAVDERVKVAAPAVMLSGHFQGGCVCENAPLLHLRYSNLHYAALIAPRPLLLLGCTGDWTHHLKEREYSCLRELYRRYDAEDALGYFYQDEEHNYNRAARERVYAWMRQWLQNGGKAPDPVEEASTPVPERSRLFVFSTPMPPYKRAIRTQDQLVDMWRRLHRAPASPAQTADILQLDAISRDDLLVRSRTPRYRARADREHLHSIDYGRFSQDSSIQCRFLPPRQGGAAFLIVRSWTDAGAWREFADDPPEEVRRLMAAGHGILLPLLYAQDRNAAVDAWLEARRNSYLVTTYHPTAAMHRAGDLVTTARMAQLEMGVPPARLVVVADGGMGLIALAGWAFLQARSSTGPLAADLGGGDLEDPEVWTERAYFPLLLGAGGVRALMGLAGKGARAWLCGMRRSSRALFPRGVVTRERGADLEALLGAAERMMHRG